VSHNPDAFSEVRRADIGSGEHRPFRVIPEVGQVTEDRTEGVSSVSGKQAWDIFHEDVARS
jgi:hypothetical protein